MAFAGHANIVIQGPVLAGPALVKRILITGAGGFIGGYLARYFSTHDYSVTASVRANSIPLGPLLPGCELIEWDLLDAKEIPANVSLDAIIHVATANDQISADPEQALRLSAIGTRRCLELARNSRIPRVIVFSTLQVYGRELRGKIDESSKIQPQNDYALNHWVAEQYLEMYVREFGLSGAVVRPSNVYGRFALPTVNRWTLVPACFCREALERGTITIRSSGLQVRNFISLENVSRACECILNKSPEGFSVYNIGSSENCSVLHVARRVKSVFEAEFAQAVQIRVEGTEPRQKNLFEVSMAKLSSLGFVEDHTISMETEIHSLLVSMSERQPRARKEDDSRNE